MVAHVEAQVLVLLAIAALVGMAARRYRMPYTIALTGAGLVLGFLELEPLRQVGLDGDLLMLLFLPALLFEAAFHIDPTALRRDLPVVLTLAVVGVLGSVGLTAVLTRAGLAWTGIAPELTWTHALLFAAVTAATDPVSVLALFKELGVPRRLYLLVEGESLLNDGVAVVVFVIVCAVAGFPTAHGAGHALAGWGDIAAFSLQTFLYMSVGGAVLGVVLGLGASALTRQVDDHLIEITLTTLVAFGSFLLAEKVHASGVLATVCAAMVLGSVGRRWGMSPSTRVSVEDFWDYAAFLANSFVFLLVGIDILPGQLVVHAPAIGIAFAAVVLSRAVVVYTLVPLASRFGAAIPRSWQHVMVWGGLRGSLSMVLVLAVPSTFPDRDLLVSLVFGTVAGSLFLQGLTIGHVVRRLGLGGTTVPKAFAVARGRLLSSRQAAASTDGLDGEAGERLRAFYDDRTLAAEEEARAAAGPALRTGVLVEGLRRLADVERDALRRGAADGRLSAEAAAELTAEIDERLDALEQAEHHGDEALTTAIERILATPGSTRAEKP